MKKQLSKIVDSVGQSVPEHLVDVFKRANYFRDRIKVINDIVAEIKEGMAVKDPLFSLVKIESLTQGANNLKSVLKFARPFAICPYCAANFSENCKVCSGRGIVNEIIYQLTPAELK